MLVFHETIAFQYHNGCDHARKRKEMCPETRFQQNRLRNKEVIANVYFTEIQAIVWSQRSENNYPSSDHSYLSVHEVGLIENSQTEACENICVESLSEHFMTFNFRPWR